MFRFLLGIFSAFLCMQFHSAYRSCKKLLFYYTGTVTCSVVLTYKISIFLNTQEEAGVSGGKQYLHVLDVNMNFCIIYKHGVWNFIMDCGWCSNDGTFASDLCFITSA